MCSARVGSQEPVRVTWFEDCNLVKVPDRRIALQYREDCVINPKRDFLFGTASERVSKIVYHLPLQHN